MFKLESYVTPLILSYLEKYVKNVKAEHSQVSLWGGDAVFSNLDLRLDVLQSELNLPLIFISGHIHELVIHVPWTRLQSEPILITINTIECILKIPESFESTSMLSRSSSSSSLHRETNHYSGLLGSLLQKIISNVKISCNNLIVKIVEDDIVLSLNIRTFTFYSANQDWKEAFSEMSISDLSQRKILEVSDATICLDKRNASGKIDIYEEPLLYRASFLVKIDSVYGSHFSRVPDSIAYIILISSSFFSLSENQIPMFLKLFSLGINLILQRNKLSMSVESEKNDGVFSGQKSSECNEDNNISWTGWATSLGSALLPFTWEEDEDEDEDEKKKKETEEKEGKDEEDEEGMKETQISVSSKNISKLGNPCIRIEIEVMEASIEFKMTNNSLSLKRFTPFLYLSLTNIVSSFSFFNSESQVFFGVSFLSLYSSKERRTENVLSYFSIGNPFQKSSSHSESQGVIGTEDEENFGLFLKFDSSSHSSHLDVHCSSLILRHSEDLIERSQRLERACKATDYSSLVSSSENSETSDISKSFKLTLIHSSLYYVHETEPFVTVSQIDVSFESLSQINVYFESFEIRHFKVCLLSMSSLSISLSFLENERRVFLKTPFLRSQGTKALYYALFYSLKRNSKSKEGNERLSSLLNFQVSDLQGSFSYRNSDSRALEYFSLSLSHLCSFIDSEFPFLKVESCNLTLRERSLTGKFSPIDVYVSRQILNWLSVDSTQKTRDNSDNSNSFVIQDVRLTDVSLKRISFHFSSSSSSSIIKPFYSFSLSSLSLKSKSNHLSFPSSSPPSFPPLNFTIKNLSFSHVESKACIIHPVEITLQIVTLASHEIQRGFVMHGNVSAPLVLSLSSFSLTHLLTLFQELIPENFKGTQRPKLSSERDFEPLFLKNEDEEGQETRPKVETSSSYSSLGRNPLDVKERRDDENEVFSLWAQFTIPSLSLSLENNDRCFEVKMEDNNLSLDSKSHYFQVKVKISSLTLEFNGRLFGARSLVTQNLFFHNFETGLRQVFPHSSSSSSLSNSRICSEVEREGTKRKFRSETNESFLSCSYTVVPLQNAAWKKMKEANEVLFSREKNDEETPRFLSELDLNISHFDIELSVEIILFTKDLIGDLIYSFPSSSSSSSLFYKISNNSLPLLYSKFKTLRIFCPYSLEDSENCYCIQIESLSFSPHVPNPLSRLIIRPNYYQLAQTWNLLNVPGSPIEDRQILFKINSLTLSLVPWKNIYGSSVRGKLKTMGENPAWEWNTQSFIEAQSDSIILLLPLQIQILLALPIVYDYDDVAPILICGLSAEINFLNDVTLNVSLTQITSLLEVYIKVFSPYSSFSSSSSSSFQSETSLDSGFDSDSNKMSNKTKDINSSSPFEIFVSGKHFIFYCYTEYDESKSLVHTRQESVIFTRSKESTCSETEYDASQEEVSSEEQYIGNSSSSSSSSLLPLFSLTLTQPHFFVSHEYKIAFSLYDASIKGGAGKRTELLSTVPSFRDFPHKLLRSKPGEENPLSGIPPSLLNLSLSKKNQWNVKCELERPLKISLSSETLAHFKNVAYRLSSSLKGKSTTTTASQVRSSFSFPNIPFSLSTQQIVISYLVKESEMTKVIGGWMNLELKVCQEPVSTLFLKAGTLSTIINGKNICLFDPWTFRLEASALEFPFNLHLSSEVLSFHLHSITLTILSSLLSSSQKESKTKRHTSREEEEEEKESNFLFNFLGKGFFENSETSVSEQQYDDDLRAGAFKYISEPSLASHPKPYQVYLSEFALTWKYPQARTMTNITVFPIPITPASKYGIGETSSISVKCSLLYWDESLKTFINYSSFTVSENETSFLDLPLIADKGRSQFSSLWRVLSHFPCQEEPSDSSHNLSSSLLLSSLKVDSYVNSNYIPKIQMFSHISLLSLSFINHFPKSRDSEFYGPFPFNSSSNSLSDHIFFSVFFYSLDFGVRLWKRNSFIIKGSYSLSASYIDYFLLENHELIYPTVMRVQFLKESSKSLDLILRSQPLEIRFGSRVNKTLCQSFNLWNPKGDLSSFPHPYISLLLINRYDKRLFVSQRNAKGLLAIESRECKNYNMRRTNCSDATRSLSLFVSCNENKNSFLEFFSLITQRSKFQDLKVHSLKFSLEIETEILFLRVLRQTQGVDFIEVYFSGQITLVSLTQEPFELLFHEGPETKERQIILKYCESISTSQICSSKVTFRFLTSGIFETSIPFYLPLKNEDFKLVVPTSESTSRIVLVSSRLESQTQSQAHSHQRHKERLLVFFSPLFIIRSFVPFPIQISVSSHEIEILKDRIFEVNGVSETETLVFKSRNNKLTSPLKIKSLVCQKTKNSVNESLDIDSFIFSLKDSLEGPLFSTLSKRIETDFIILTGFIQSTLSTLLTVDLVPKVLLRNELQDTRLVVQSSETTNTISPNSSFVPHHPDSVFHLGLLFQGKYYFSEALQISHGSKAGLFKGMIPLEGSIETTIVVGNSFLMHLTLLSEQEHESQVISIISTYVLSLPSSNMRALRVEAVRGDRENEGISLEFKRKGELRSFALNNPLVYWSLTHQSSVRDSSENEFLSVSLHNSSSSTTYIPIQKNLFDKRQCFYLFDEENVISNYPLVVVMTVVKSQIIIVFDVDETPQFLFHNRLKATLVFKEEEEENDEYDAKIQKNNSLLMSLKEGKSAYYTMKCISKAFPEPVKQFPKMNFALFEPHTQSFFWSCPLNVICELESRFELPNYGPVKIKIQKIEGTLHLDLESSTVNNDVEALEIRSRLEFKPSNSLSIPRNQNTEFSLSQRKKSEKQKISVCVFLEELSVSLSDDFPVTRNEILRLTLDGISIRYFSSEKVKLSSQTSLSLSVRNAQLDNQMFWTQNYDFPIIFIGHEKEKRKVKNDSISSFLHQSLHESSEFQGQDPALLDLYCNLNSSHHLVSLRLKMTPFHIYIEDVFWSRLYKEIDSLVSYYDMPKKNKKKNKNKNKNDDDDFSFLSSNYSKCTLEEILIEPLDVYVSLRSVLKMYIGIDSSHLCLGAYERRSLQTSYYYIGENLARHYISGTLFQSGWVLGSLELLGSPSGFTRSLGDGLKDFIFLPYVGIFGGPVSLLFGLIQGSSSLVKHISAGTLTSLFNFTSSVSRNLDRLSFDAEYCVYNEMSRRSTPNGLGDGLFKGLSGIGIAVLAAIGGLSHHPLQALLSKGPSGLFLGVSKGLLGVVTKPLGGAAEFVSCTSQGLLAGIGVSPCNQPRVPITSGSVSSSYNNNKQTNKEFVYSSLALERFLGALEPIKAHLPVSRTSDFLPCTLLLTSTHLFIIHEDEEDKTSQTSYSVGVTGVENSLEDPTVISISFEERFVPDRVAIFVSQINSQSITREPLIPSSASKNLTYSASPTLIPQFISHFIIVKRHFLKKGFRIL